MIFSYINGFILSCSYLAALNIYQDLEIQYN